MRLVAFGPDAAHAPDHDLLQDVTVAPLTAALAAGATVQAACFRLAPGGRIVRHPATVPQLLAVVGGGGWVSGEDAREQRIEAGSAAFWEAGESHETRTDEGMTAIVIEGDGVLPFSANRA